MDQGVGNPPAQSRFGKIGSRSLTGALQDFARKQYTGQALYGGVQGKA